MGLKDFFKKNKKSELDPLRELTLARLKVGYLVDYDLKSWEVTACNRYDWGDGDISREWQLKSAEEVVYLEKESDDDEEWSLNRKIAFGRLGSEIKARILEKGDPPDEVLFEGSTYYKEETAGGLFYKNGQDSGQEMLRWSYEDEEGEVYLGIEQWGEQDFDATIGKPVEEYQFTNILPGGNTPAL
ncbi:DUF4178 domain-containing protein [Thermodesulfobacteriota bacterium]